MKLSWGFGFLILLSPIATFEKSDPLSNSAWYSNRVETWTSGEDVGLKKVSYELKDSVLTLKVQCQISDEKMQSSKSFPLTIHGNKIFIHNIGESDRESSHCNANLPVGEIPFQKVENELKLSFPEAPLELFQIS